MGGRLRGFGLIQPALSILAMPFGFIIWGLAAVPGLWLFTEAGRHGSGWETLMLQGAAIGIGLLAWCIADLLMLGVFGLLMRPRSGPAQAPTESWLTIRWAFMSLFHRLAQPALQWMVPSFVGTLYYRMMGVEVGAGAQINSPSINDAYMVRIGERTVVGGEAAINGHLFEKDGIHLAQVEIGADCIIGAYAMINPGCVIGDGAVIASRAVLPKHTEVPSGEVWGGIPARRIRDADGNRA